MPRAFYDLRADQPTSPRDLALLQQDGEADRDRRCAERAHRRDDAPALRRALTRLHR
jgi:hypothetical protein